MKKTFGVYLFDFARASGKTTRGSLIRELRNDDHLINLSSPRSVRKAVIAAHGDVSTVTRIVDQYETWRSAV